MPSFLPHADSALLSWGINFASLLTATPGAFGISQTQADAFEALQIAFGEAYQRAADPDTSTRPAVAEKNANREAMKQSARRLAKLIGGTENVTDAQKLSLGLTVRKQPTRIPAPTDRPGMNFVAVVGRTVTVQLHDSAMPKNRGKPDGVVAAYVYTYVGAVHPADRADWQFQGACRKRRCEINFPHDLPGGTQVWVCAAWVNAKQEPGPASTPIMTNLQGGGVSALPMKMAA